MVDLKANGIPQLRRDLPLVNQPWRCTFQQALWIQFGHGDVLLFLLRLIHLQNAGSDLFRRSGFAAPLWPLNQDSAFALQLPRQYLIGNPFPILLHSEHLDPALSVL